MSLCSAEEIAEKKRIAIEKLKAKKAEIAKTVIQSHVSAPQNLPVNSFYNQSASKSQPIACASSTIVNKSNANRISSDRIEKPSWKRRRYENSDKCEEKIAPVFVRVVTCTCYLISDRRFVVSPSEFHSKVIDVFKTIPSRNYDPNKRLWSFDIKDYDLVRERYEGLKPNIVIGSIPNSVLKICSSPQKELSYLSLSSISNQLQESLLPFQREGVRFGISKHGRVLIADEMGLGKTYQALALADFYRDDFPMLIGTTASTRDTWVSHIRKLLPSIPCQEVVCLTSAQDYFSEAKVVVSSYALLEKCIGNFLEMNFGILIMDESHTLKNSKAKCTVVVDKLSKKARRVIMLTATPALSRPVELYSQLKMIDRTFMSFMDYTTRYCDGKSSKYGWEANGKSNLCELNVILSKKFMIRRLKADVLPQLALKCREKVFLDPDLIWSCDISKKCLDSFKETLSQSRGRDKELALLNYYAQTAIVKCKAVCAYLKGLVKEKIKFIVFAHHKVMLDGITRCFKELKVKHIRIDGSTKNDLRSKYVDTFQKNEKCQVAVLSIKACNTGITLTAAQLVVFAELDWNPSTLVQAESRAHRIGQEGTVTCRYLIAQNTVDDEIWNMLKRKQIVLNEAGLFCEDLENAEHVVVPSSSGNISKYFGKTIKTDALKEKVLNSTVLGLSKNSESSDDDSDDRKNYDDNDLMNLLNDDDNDFENLLF